MIFESAENMDTLFFS